MADEKEAKKQPKKEKKTFRAYRAPAKVCPKCGSRMADHKDRFACGRCGYTEWKEKA